MLTPKHEHDNRYTLFEGKLYLEKRPTISPYWQARTSFQSRQKTASTKCTDLRSAAEWAEKWYLNLRYKLANNEPIETKRTLATTYKAFIEHHKKLIETGESSKAKVERYEDTWRNIKDRLGNIDIERLT